MTSKLLILLLFLTVMTTVDATPQDDVDYVVRRIQTTLEGSMDQPGWKARYEMAGKNIEDLQNALRRGGKVTSNPVKAFYDKLSALLDEREAQYKIFCETQAKLTRLRKSEAREAINDIGVEMVIRLTRIKPGVLTPLSWSNDSNAKVIKADFERLRTQDQAIALIESYKTLLLPSIRDVRDRKHGLSSLLEGYAALTLSAPAQTGSAFEGTWTVLRRHSGCCGYSATNQCSFSTTGGLLKMASSDAAFEGAVAQRVSGGTCTFRYGRQATLTVTIDGRTLTGSFNDGTHRGSLSGQRVK